MPLFDELKEIFGEILPLLRENDIEAVVIGSTVVSLELGGFFKENEDIDFFVTNRSPFLEEDLFKNMALMMGWDYAYTDYGTPRIVVPKEIGEFFIDFYENIHDFYVPHKVLEEETKSIRVDGQKLKHISLEAYVVLKSRIGREIDDQDLERISQLTREGYLKIDRKKTSKLLQYFPEEEIGMMRNRLRRHRLIE